MELNLYDIVEYNGNRHRVMAIDSYDGDLDLAGVDIWVNPDSVTLVEPFIQIPKRWKPSISIEGGGIVPFLNLSLDFTKTL